MLYIAYLRDKAATYRALAAGCLDAHRPPRAAECEELAKICEAVAEEIEDRLPSG